MAVDPRFNILTKQERRLFLIGMICSQWSHLEYLFSLAIWRLLKLDNETGKILTGGLDIIPRARMAINLAHHLKATPAVRKALTDARKDIQDRLQDRRNEAVHGVHFVSDDAEKLMIEVHRGKGTRKQKELSIRDLNTLCSDIYATSIKLQAVIDATWHAPRAS